MATPPTPEPTDPQRQNVGRTLANLPPLPAGAVWVLRADGKWAIDRTASPTDHAHAADPQTAAQHETILRQAQRFAERAQRTRNLIGWDDLHTAATDFTAAINRPTAELPDHIKRVWQDLVTLATFIDLDNELRAHPHDAIETLAPDLRRQLSALLVLAAPFVRGFPTALVLDNEAGAFVRRLDLHPPARAVLEDARKETWIEPTDVDAELVMLRAGERGELQSHKASTHGVASSTNLFHGIARYAATFVLGMAANAWVNESPQWRAIGRFIARHEPNILALTEDQPPDIRDAMRVFVTETAKAVQKEDDTPLPPADPPEGFSQAAAEQRILRGDELPPNWRPHVTQLGFGLWSWHTNGELRPLPGPTQRHINLNLLADLPNLQALALSSMEVNQIAPLRGLANLRVLDLSNTQISRLEHLAGLANLRRLDLSNTKVSDLRHIAGLANLQDLFLVRTQVSDLQHLAGLANLQRLDLANTPVSDLQPLARLPKLQTLSLSNTQISRRNLAAFRADRRIAHLKAVAIHR